MAPNVTTRTQSSGDPGQKAALPPMRGVATSYIPQTGVTSAALKLRKQLASAAALRAGRILMLLALAIPLCQLTACGGGGDDETTVPTPAVNCQARPELCK